MLINQCSPKKGAFCVGTCHGTACGLGFHILGYLLIILSERKKKKDTEIMREWMYVFCMV